MGFKDISEASDFLDAFWKMCSLYNLDCKDLEGKLCPFRKEWVDEGDKPLCQLGLFDLSGKELFQITSAIQNSPYNTVSVSNNQNGISW